VEVHVEHAYFGDVVVIKFPECVFMEWDFDLLEEGDRDPIGDFLTDLIERGNCKIVVDLSNSGLLGPILTGALIGAKLRCLKMGGDVKASGYYERDEERPPIPDVGAVFGRWKSVEEAVAAFGESAKGDQVGELRS
jgi:hypothetical protein